MGRDILDRKICNTFLQCGQDFQIADGLTIHHPTIQEILSLGGGIQCEAVYWAYVYTLISDPYNHMVWLDDKGIDYETVSAFDVFILRWLDAKEEYLSNKTKYDKAGYIPEEMFSDALSFFLGKREYDIAVTSNRKFYICDLNDSEWGIDGDIYGWVHTFIQVIHCMSDANKILPATKSAKRVLIEDMRDGQKRAKRNRKKKDDEINLIGDSISTIVHGGKGGVTPFNFTGLHIYQLLSGATITHNQMRVHAMLNGIYTGMLGTNNLSESELCWTKV